MLRFARALLLVTAMLSFESTALAGHVRCETGDSATDTAGMTSPHHADGGDGAGVVDCVHTAAGRGADQSEQAPAPGHSGTRCAYAQSCVATALPGTPAVKLTAVHAPAARPAAPAVLIAGLRPAPDVPPPRA